MGGGAPPPPLNGGEDVHVGANQHVHPREEKGGGGGTNWRSVANCWQGLGLGGIEYAGKAWTWTPTWSALMDFRGVGTSPGGGAREREGFRGEPAGKGGTEGGGGA